MNAKHWMTLRVLLNKYHSGPEDALLKILPEKHAAKLEKQTVASSDIRPIIASPLEFLKLYHYSWLGPVIQQLPKELQSLTIAALPEPYCSRLRQRLNLKEVRTLSPPIKQFLVQNLYSRIQETNVLPIEYLPDSPLDELKVLSKKELIELFDYLAIFDLAHEVKQIVDKKIWQGLHACLTPEKKQFLDLCMKRKKTLSPPNPMLRGWSGNCEQFNKILQVRGIKRMAYALAGERASFVWYLAHRLDTGRGKMLLKHYSKQSYPKITPMMQQEVLKALKFHNKMRT